VKIGLDLYPVRVSWPEVREVALLADRLGYDSLWTWDHLYGHDDPDQAIFEGWTTIAGIAAVTERTTVGLLVGANTLRDPGLIAKMAVTVDHISGGRAVLGLGAGWRPQEHHDHGIRFGSGFGERIDWLEESVDAISGLLAGEVVTSPTGGRYALHGAHQVPLPVRGPGRIPLLIGGGGERRTIPLAARRADIWHHRGSAATLAAKLDVLRASCAGVGRDPAEIELAFGPLVVIRDDPAAARDVLRVALARLGQEVPDEPDEAWVGPEELVLERLAPYLDIGFRHLIVGLPAPYDLETVTRLATLREALRNRGR
jgi:alkanesulfonate monooxygenase SsuD/methylene tetrahydromethanopterin reductase-like flavin-dependent oxidoreductase (luciferase family)